MTERKSPAGRNVGTYTTLQGIVRRLDSFGICPKAGRCSNCQADLAYLQAVADRLAVEDA